MNDFLANQNKEFNSAAVQIHIKYTLVHTIQTQRALKRPDESGVSDTVKFSSPIMVYPSLLNHGSVPRLISLLCQRFIDVQDLILFGRRGFYLKLHRLI